MQHHFNYRGFPRLSFVSISLHITIGFSIFVLLRTELGLNMAIPHVFLSIAVDYLLSKDWRTVILTTARSISNSCLMLLDQVARLNVAKRGFATDMLGVLVLFLVSLHSDLFLELKLATWDTSWYYSVNGSITAGGFGLDLTCYGKATVCDGLCLWCLIHNSWPRAETVL